MSGFVGRVSELATLRAVLAAAETGIPGFALVGGEPGIGKTQLLEAAGHLAGARGWRVLWGRASNADGAPAFWPWRQIVRQWQPDAEAGPQLRRIIPEFAGTAPAGTPDGAEDRFVAFDQFCRLLAAEDTRILLLLDDLHAADAGSLSLLTSVVRDVRDCGVVVMGAFRPAELPAAAELRTLVERQRNGTVVHLAGFSADEVGTQLGALLDRQPEPAAVAEVLARTQGNPLFVQQLGRLLAAGRPLGDGVPEVIREVIRQHLDNLTPASRETLGVAAFLGAAIAPGVLAAVTGQPIAEVLSQLAEATRVGVVTRDAGFAFRHDLFQETLRDEMPAAETHLRIAVALEAGTPARLGEVARHRLAALPLGDAVIACGAAHSAGQAAVRGLAFEDAAELFDAALAAAPAELPAAARCALLIDAGKLRFLLRDTDGALERCTAAAELAQRAGDPVSLANAALSLPEFPEPRWTSLVAGWCEHALTELPAGDSSLRAQLLAQRALANVFVAGPARMAEESGVALAMARRLDDPAALEVALRARQIARASPDGHGERFELGTEMVQLGHRDGDLNAVFWGHLWRFDALVQAGRIDEADAELIRLDPVAVRLGQPVRRWHALRSRVAVEIARGHFADAATHARQQAEYVPGGLTARAPFWATLMIARLTGDDSVLLADPLAPDFAHPMNPPANFMNLAPWHLAHGRTEEAAELYRALPETGGIRVPHYFSVVVDAMRCEVTAALGDAAGAAAAYKAVLPFAEQHAAAGAGISVTLGSARLYLGLAAGAAGRPDDAIDHLTAGAKSNEEGGLRPFAALSRYHLAVAQHARGHSDQAERELRTAEHIAGQLGMAPLVALAVDLRARLSARHPLTPRQRELAGLLALGHSNKQIAAALHLSERTVENHVRNIMTALGVTSRVEVATWVAKDEG